MLKVLRLSNENFRQKQIKLLALCQFRKKGKCKKSLGISKNCKINVGRNNGNAMPTGKAN